MRKACETHVKLTKECSRGLGQDRYALFIYLFIGPVLFPVLFFFLFSLMEFNRHLYAMYCLVQRQLQNKQETQSASFITKMPSIYTDPGWALLGTSILSTSNCGNPALRLFGFGPVAADGYGIGYIIKEDGISVYVFPLPSSFISKLRFSFTLNQLRIFQTPSNSSFPGYITRISFRYSTTPYTITSICE